MKGTLNYHHKWKLILTSIALVMITGCASTPKSVSNATSKTDAQKPHVDSKNNTTKTEQVQLPAANSGRGAYYKDDGPGENPPLDLESIVDPIPVVENYSRSGNKPYAVFGKTYTPITDNVTPFKQRGIASWYGKKFHGKKTSSGELYDMYKMTAAHPTLPIPSYARVTNLDNGKQIIVRVNDRGPFHSNRIVDLSYTAALKLAYLGKGSSLLEIERLLPEDIEKMAENSKNQKIIAPLATNNVVRNERDVKEYSTLKTSDAEMSAKNETANALDKMLEKSQENPPTTNANYYLQLGAFAIRANAQLSMDKFKSANSLPDLNIVQNGSLYRLISGPFSTKAEAAIAQANNGGVVVLR